MGYSARTKLSPRRSGFACQTSWMSWPWKLWARVWNNIQFYVSMKGDNWQPDDQVGWASFRSGAKGGMYHGANFMDMQGIYEYWGNASGNAMEWKRIEVNVVGCCGGALKIERNILWTILLRKWDESSSIKQTGWHQYVWTCLSIFPRPRWVKLEWRCIETNMERARSTNCKDRQFHR